MLKKSMPGNQYKTSDTSVLSIQVTPNVRYSENYVIKKLLRTGMHVFSDESKFDPETYGMPVGNCVFILLIAQCGKEANSFRG